MQRSPILKRFITFILRGIILFGTFKKFDIAIAMMKNTQIAPKLFYIWDAPIWFLLTVQSAFGVYYTYIIYIAVFNTNSLIIYT